MKKYLSLLISAFLVISSYNYTVEADSLNEALNMIPKSESQNTTRITPWFLLCHLQSAYQAEHGIMGGEAGQVLMSMDRSPFDKNLILMGADTIGIWRSTNNGHNWVPISHNMNMPSIPCIKFDPFNKDVVYAVFSAGGTTKGAEDYLINTELDGIYKSLDGGLTWDQILHVKIGCDRQSNRLLVFDSSGSLYALTNEGVIKTSDGGVTWSNLGCVSLDTVENGAVFDMIVSDDGNFIITACQTTGIRVSENGGKTWERRNVIDGDVTAYSILIDPLNKNHWLAAFGDDKKGVYESYNKGRTWQLFLTPLTEKSIPARMYFGPVNSNGESRLYIFSDYLSNAMRYTDNMGISWEIPSYPVFPETALEGIAPYYSYPLLFDENDENSVMIATTSGIGRSDDRGTTFINSTAGYSGVAMRNFLFDKDGYLWMGSVDKGLFVSDEPFKANSFPTLTLIDVGRYENSKTVSFCAIDPDNGNHVLICNGSWSKQIISESFDRGKTWMQLQGTESDVSYRYMSFHPNDSKVIYAGQYISYDGAKSWKLQKDGDKVIYIREMSLVNPDVLIGVSGMSLYKSTDRGLTWIKICDSPTNNEFMDACCDRFDENVFWATTSIGDIFKVEKDSVQTLLKNGKRFYSIAQNPKNPLHVLAGGSSHGGISSPGLYETVDGGKSWNIVQGMPSTKMIYEVSFSPLEDKAFVSTYCGTFIYDYNVYHKYLSESDNSNNNLPSYIITSELCSNTKEGVSKVVSAGSDGRYKIGQVEGKISNGNSNRLYYRIELKNLPKDIESASFTINCKLIAGGTLNTYKVDNKWYADTNINLLKDVQLINSMNIPYSPKVQDISIDITDYIKELADNDDNIAKLMLDFVVKTDRFESKEDAMSICNIHNAINKPYITIKQKSN